MTVSIRLLLEPMAGHHATAGVPLTRSFLLIPSVLWEQRHHRVAARGGLHILELCVQERGQLPAIPNPHPRRTPLHDLQTPP